MKKSAFRFFTRGLTLVEMMTSLAVGGLLLTIGVPSATTLIANNQMTASTNDLVSHLQYARSEAIKRQSPVTVCSSGDGQICANSTEWGVGWIVFTDASGTEGTLDGSDQLLRIYQPTGYEVSISSGSEYVRYQSDGALSI